MTPLILYYDGLCPLCYREMEHYRRRALPGSIDFVDITEPSFDAVSHGLDPRRVHRVMHARRGTSLLTGMDAFIAVWETIPGLGWAARLAKLSVINALLVLGYHLFALVRPLLPRLKRDDCETGVCNRVS